jgi:hypothetical protein
MKRLELYLEFVNFNNIVFRTCSFHFVFFNICSKKSASRGASAAYMRVVDNSYLGTSDEVCSHFESHVLHSKY